MTRCATLFDESLSPHCSRSPSCLMAINQFDDIFKFIGGFGPFQWLICGLMCLCNIFCCTIHYGQLFMSATPPHWCNISPDLKGFIDNGSLPALTLELVKQLTIPLDIRGMNYEQCQMYDVDFVKILTENQTWPDAAWPVTSCKYGWAYNFSLYYPTITSQNNWVCQEDWKPTLAMSMFFVGSIIGGLMFGWMADTFGRVYVIVISNTLAGIAGVASAFCNTLISFSLARFVVGIAYDTQYVVIHILLMEYVAPEYRSFATNVPFIVFSTFTLGTMPWLALAVRDWSLYAIIIYAPCILSIFFIWGLVSLSYDNIIRNTQILGENFFVMFTIMAFVMLAAEGAALFFVETLGRKSTCFLSLILCGIVNVSVSLFDSQENQITVAILAYVGGFFITMALNVGLQYMVEIIPTVARGQGIGIIHTTGMITVFIAPYITYLAKYGIWLPYFICGVITFVSGLLCLLLPETKGKELPDSLQDGEEFFKGQPIFHNPFMK